MQITKEDNLLLRNKHKMKVYQELLQHVLTHGEERIDRTGVGTIGVFGYQMRFDLSEGFPLLTTKKLHLRSIIHELLWFIKGSTNTRYALICLEKGAWLFIIATVKKFFHGFDCVQIKPCPFLQANQCIS